MAGEKGISKATPVSPMLTSKVRDTQGFKGDATDILIPRLLLGQSTTKAVQDEKISFGQVYRSTTLDAVGGKGKPLHIIPLSHNKTWVISEKVGGKFEFRKIEPFTSQNKDRAWTWTEAKDGRQQTEWKAVASLNFFVLLPADIVRDLEARAEFEKTGELPDTEASLLPCAISFQSTSYKTGKTLVTHFAKAADFGVKPYVTTFSVDTEKTQNDSGVFYVFRMEKFGKTEERFHATCDKWRDIVQSHDVKVDDADVAERAGEVESMERDAEGNVTDF